MYELRKKKKRNIIVAIILFLFISGVIREAIRLNTAPPPISKQLDDFANSINKRCPLVVDSTLTLSNCMAMLGNRLHFNYITTQLTKDQIDTVSLIVESRKEFVNRIKTNPDMSSLKSLELYYTATYYDQDGNYVCGVAVTPEDYQ